MKKNNKKSKPMGELNYRITNPEMQQETKIVAELFFSGHKMEEISKSRQISNNQCFDYICAALDFYEPIKKSGQHLSFQDRLYIEFQKKRGISNKKIACVLKCHPSTIANELKRMNGNSYSSEKAQKDYENKIKSCHDRYKFNESKTIIQTYVKRLKEFKESPYSFIEALKRGEITELADSRETVSFKSLYNWINAGLIEGISKSDLPYGNRIKKEKKIDFKKEDSKRLKGNSIDLRPSFTFDEDGNIVDFGHFEIDCLLGTKDSDEPVLLVLIERKTRFMKVVMLPEKNAANVNEAVSFIKNAFGENWTSFFKTITTDNGSEFVHLHEIQDFGPIVFYCHPGSPKEKPAVERANEMIRVFIPKGTKLSEYSEEDIKFITKRINNTHRKVLGGETSESLFVKELKKLQLQV